MVTIDVIYISDAISFMQDHRDMLYDIEEYFDSNCWVKLNRNAIERLIERLKNGFPDEYHCQIERMTETDITCLTVRSYKKWQTGYFRVGYRNFDLVKEERKKKIKKILQ